MTTTATVPTIPAQADVPDPRRYWSLAVIALAQLMIVLDASVVIVALPSAQRALHISVANRQWVMSSYTLAFGSLLLLGGRIADYLGRRRMFIVGLIGFGAASALGGLAQDPAMLFGARALQGAFAAVMAPAALSLLTTTFTETHASAPVPSASTAPSPAVGPPSGWSSEGRSPSWRHGDGPFSSTFRSPRWRRWPPGGWCARAEDTPGAATTYRVP